MKPSDLKKAKEQSDKVKKANEKFAAAAARDKVLKNNTFLQKHSVLISALVTEISSDKWTHVKAF